MFDKIADQLRELSDLVEKKGFIKEAYELGEISNLIYKEAEELLSYKISLEKEGEDDLLKIGFGTEAHNDKIVKDAAKLLDDLMETKLKGGRLLKINGPASLPVAMHLSHKLSHLYSAIACYDPKLRKYVISISHDPDYPLGTLID
jgi:CRISPR-associated protein Csx3